MEFYKIRIKYLFKTAEVIIPVKNQFLQEMGLNFLSLFMAFVLCTGNPGAQLHPHAAIQ